MNPDQLIKHFDRISEAPDAISRLRQFILDLAVRGKLVEQDSQDEPAAELFRKIRTEKARLKSLDEEKEDTASEMKSTQFDFALPLGWKWCRWNSIALKIGDIDHKMPDTVLEGVPYVSPRDFLPNNQIDFDTAKRVSMADFLRLSAKIKPDVGDIIYPRYGTIGENRLVTVKRDFLASYSCAVIKALTGFVDPSYQYFYSISPYCRQQARAAENKTTQANVGIKSIKDFIVPLPPLAEQRRITAKVDELMALCDDLESAKAEREERRDSLVAASLHHLNNGSNAVESRKHASFYLEHLPDLTARAEHVRNLRRTILNLAVQGKLVAQDSDDESASELLSRIYLEKAQSSKNGLVPISPEPKEVSFPLPEGWKWARLGDVIQLVSGQHLQPGEYSDNPQSGPPYITGPADFSPNGLLITRYALVRKAVATKGQILLTVKGAGVGKTAICNLPEVAISRQLMSMTAIKWSQDFLLLITHRLAEMLKDTARSLIPGISRENVNDFILGVPPLAEQHRIVCKVDQLMALCDQLDAQLANAQNETQRFLEAVLHSALKVNDHYELAALAETT